MLAHEDPPKESAFKNPLLYSWIALAIAALMVFGILFSRWLDSHNFEERAKQAKAQKQKEEDKATVELLGGKELAIQNFYASPGIIRRGQSLQLCYGVANARTVKLEPQSNPVWPSYARCVEVTPTKSTTYTLTVADAAGNTKTQSLEVKVQ